ncbi:MAG: hypothetical protein O3A36_01100 [bacterium]|nr:hypothetical protein [bacterium]
MKSILPISIATLFLFAPTFHYVQGLAPNKNVPDVPFHTPAYTTGTSLPRHITNSLTVGPEDGIILIHTVVTIDAGATLTIKPGTIIAVSEYGGIQIFGNLDARGTKRAPIQFISNELNERNRNWNGILFENTGAGSVEHAIFHHASPAISCAASGNVIMSSNTSLFGNLDLWGSC